ncbi:MAG: DUF2520 domain-containing protein [Acidobacteria bacterium]|nr:DUF2520 domain-containing protein [Acidobacteriota bacterium]
MAIVKILIVGAGRAGTSFAAALDPRHDVTLIHHGELGGVVDADLVLLCVRDDAIEATSRRVVAPAHTVVAHVAGSRGLDVLADHVRVGSMHPLVTMPDAERGAQRLRGGVFAVEGDALVRELVASLGGRVITVAAGQRVRYHAAAAAAANHLVALMGHVETLASASGVDVGDFVGLAQQALDDVARVGPSRALTGPAARGDVATIAAHLASLPPDERATYEVLAERAQRLATRGVVSCTD